MERIESSSSARLKRVRDSISVVIKKPTGREKWSGRFDFLLSCIGYAVGLGTIWRFPYVCYRNGGGAFLIPYLIYMLLMGMPLVLMEMGYGQFSSLSPIAVWKISPLFQGIGYGMVIISAIVCVYYNVIIAWTLYYFAMSFTWTLPWSNCNNRWNTDRCFTRWKNVTTNGSVAAAATVAAATTQATRTTLGNEQRFRSPSEEFWEYNVLGISDGIENMGTPHWHLAVSLLVAWIIIFLCLCKGVKTSGKVVYVTATLPYVLLICFLVRGATLEGAITGIRFYIIPKWSQLLTFQPWAESAQQLFYSMGTAWGALITMASYNKFNNNFYRDAVIVSLTDTFTAFLTGFVIFSTIGFMANETGLPVSDVVTDGPGLVFVVLPEAIAHMPGATIWAIIFFVFIFFVGVDSQFGMFETVLSALFDQYPGLRRYKIVVTAVLSIIEFLLGLTCISAGGVYVFQILDWYCSTFSLMVLSLMECIVISWIYGTERFYRDMTLMLGFRPCRWWGLCWRFISPLLITFVLMVNMVQHTPVTYGSYIYPTWAIGLGWLFALCSVIPIPIVIIIKLAAQKGPMKKRVSSQIKPAPDWGPADELQREEYSRMNHGTTEHPLLWWGRNPDVVLFTSYEEKKAEGSNEVKRDNVVETVESVTTYDVNHDAHDHESRNREAHDTTTKESKKAESEERLQRNESNF